MTDLDGMNDVIDFLSAGGEVSRLKRADVESLVEGFRSLTTRLAVAQGTATAETHRADRAEERVGALEREALKDAEKLKLAGEAFEFIEDTLRQGYSGYADTSRVRAIEALGALGLTTIFDRFVAALKAAKEGT